MYCNSLDYVGDYSNCLVLVFLSLTVLGCLSGCCGKLIQAIYIVSRPNPWLLPQYILKFHHLCWLCPDAPDCVYYKFIFCYLRDVSCLNLGYKYLGCPKQHRFPFSVIHTACRRCPACKDHYLFIFFSSPLLYQRVKPSVACPYVISIFFQISIKKMQYIKL